MRMLVACLALAATTARAGPTLRITSEPPGADVYLDDEYVGATPVELPFPMWYFYAAGAGGRCLGEELHLRAEHSGFWDWEEEITRGPMRMGPNIECYHLPRTVAIELMPIDLSNQHDPNSPDRLRGPARIAMTGSGFVAWAPGLVVTSAHVVHGAVALAVYRNGITCPATIAAQDQDADLAVLRIEETCRDALALGAPLPVRASPVRVGEDTLVFGYPLAQQFGGEPLLSMGVVTSLSGLGADRRYLTLGNPVQPGNSGGPVVSSAGEVVGVVAAKMDDIATLIESGTVTQGVSFAVKAEHLAALAVVSRLPPGETAPVSGASLADRVDSLATRVVLVANVVGLGAAAFVATGAGNTPSVAPTSTTLRFVPAMGAESVILACGTDFRGTVPVVDGVAVVEATPDGVCQGLVQGTVPGRFEVQSGATAECMPLDGRVKCYP